jgi:hypothetical protein
MINHSEHIINGETWKLEVFVDRTCLRCMLDSGDDEQGGATINREFRMINLYNYEIITEDECAAEGNHDYPGAEVN